LTAAAVQQQQTQMESLLLLVYLFWRALMLVVVVAFKVEFKQKKNGTFERSRGWSALKNMLPGGNNS